MFFAFDCSLRTIGIVFRTRIDLSYPKKSIIVPGKVQAQVYKIPDSLEGRLNTAKIDLSAIEEKRR